MITQMQRECLRNIAADSSALGLIHIKTGSRDPRRAIKRLYKDWDGQRGSHAYGGWDALECRAQLYAGIESCRNGRHVYFRHYSRDCDLMEVDRVVTKSALVPLALEQWIEDERANAEGPCHIFLIEWDDGESFQNTWRDIAAEQAGY